MKNDRVEIDGKYAGFEGKNGFIFLQRCPKCDRENWAIAVASGTCSWCGFDANQPKSEVKAN